MQAILQGVGRHGPRIAVTLLPLMFAVLHAVGVLQLGVLQRLDEIIYDARLRATLPATLDERVVIVDIDEKSLAELGRWPWPRDQLARLVDTLFDQQGIALLGFDTVFAEPDDSAGLRQLERLAQRELADQPGFAQRVEALRPQLDHDAQLARALQGRPVVLGYYFTSDRGGHTSGVLPAPVLEAGALQPPGAQGHGCQAVDSSRVGSSRCWVSPQPTREKPWGVHSRRLMAALPRCQVRGACRSRRVAAR